MALADEKLIALKELAALVPSTNGKSMSPVTVWQWARYGRKDVRLEHVRLPSGLYASSIEAVHRFLKEVAAKHGWQTTPIISRAVMDAVIEGRLLKHGIRLRPTVTPTSQLNGTG